MSLPPPSRTLPPFRMVSSAMGMLSPEEIDGLLAREAPKIAEAMLGRGGGGDASVRRSQVAFLTVQDYRWLYERVWAGAADFNRSCFGVEIDGIAGQIQLARYDATDSGFYDWHMDFSELAPQRKISLTVQLSDPADYDGGDLEFSLGGATYKAERARGLAIAFPSFALHRVAPVTRGTRWSLVAWITGPRWR